MAGWLRPPNRASQKVKPMSTSSTTAENAIGIDQRTIDHDRVVRALTEDMTVTTDVENMPIVEHDGREYTVDLVQGSCDCHDAQYRPATYCKHGMKAALVAIFSEGVTTPFVARVVRYFTEHPCPLGNDHVCMGPVGPCLPCPGCIAGTNAGEYIVWQMTEKRTGVQR
jgi:hypothetical protein